MAVERAAVAVEQVGVAVKWRQVVAQWLWLMAMGVAVGEVAVEWEGDEGG